MKIRLRILLAAVCATLVAGSAAPVAPAATALPAHVYAPYFETDWAAANGRPLQISYTLPTSASGLESSGLAVLQNAIANNTRVDLVNIVTFDYYDRVTRDMGAAAINAANGLVNQLGTLYPGKTLAERQAMVGIALMPGLDDYPRRTESTSVADAQRVYNYGLANGFDTLSIWAVQRDNGGCPGNTGSNSCSGIVQNTWDFSHVLNPFTGP